MTPPSTALVSFLSRDWAGLALAAVAAAVAAALPGDPTLAGRAIGVAATLMAIGSITHLIRRRAVLRRHPAPGSLVDVGGYRMHVLAEGDPRGRAAVVWLPGGHAGAFALHHLHRAIRDEARSILIDRPGSGWSDTGPFPCTTAREAAEVVTALQRGGERGPFVLVGHSFGGLLAANIARRRPDLVSGLVLLDATPPDALVYGPRQAGLRSMPRMATWTGLLRLFGLGRRQRRQGSDTGRASDRISRIIDERLGEAGIALRAVEGASVGNCFANASIFRELSPQGMAASGWDAATYDGDLVDLPVWIVAPGDVAEVQSALPEAVSGPEADRQRVLRVMARTRERYMATSTRARRVVTPAGTGHNFPYESPESVIAVVREALG